MKYYVYIWFRNDGTPYYVGKGSGDRGFTSDSHRVHCPKSLEQIFIKYLPSEKMAFIEEMALIRHFGRKDLGTGLLRNLTDGGENPPNWQGKKRSQHHKDAAKAAAKGRRPSQACLEAAWTKSRTKKGIPRPEAIWWKGRKHTEESKAKMSLAQRGKSRPHTEEWKQNMSRIMKGRKITWGNKISATKRRQNAL